jgi:hypothetical protein
MAKAEEPYMVLGMITADVPGVGGRLRVIEHCRLSCKVIRSQRQFLTVLLDDDRRAADQVEVMDELDDVDGRAAKRKYIFLDKVSGGFETVSGEADFGVVPGVLACEVTGFAVTEFGAAAAPGAMGRYG